MKRSIQTISFVLIFALLVQFVPVGVFATDDEHITSTELDLTTSTQVNSNDAFDGIIAEDKSKREETVKHFLCADGTYKAVSYGTRVHWKPTENSNWIPIDNRLTLQTSDGEFFYTPISSPVDVRLAYKSEANHLASYKIGENTISWYYEGGAADVTPVVESGLSTASATADKSSPAILQNLTGVITYENLFDNTDVQYTVTPEGIKDDIILKNASAATSYQVTYDISGMTATQSGNTIVLAKNGKDIATLGAPIAEDAAGSINKNADLELMSTRSGKMTIQVSADTSWLAEKTRTYPIKIDPYVFEVIEDASDDASALYSWSSYPYGTLVVGKIHSYGKARAFLRFALPELSSGDMVIGGQLVLSQYQTSTGYYASNGKAMTIQVKRVTEDWPGATIRNSKSFSGLPAVSNEIEEYIETNEVSSKTYRDFDLSELTKGWYNGSYDNYGICLSSTEEDRMAQTSFVSRNNSSYPEHWPNLVVSYLNNKGLESRWTYHNQSAGSSGEGYVNDYTGNLVFIAPIMADSGNMVPMSVHVVYNGYQAGAYSGAMKAGLGWRLDYAQSIEALSSSSADALVKALYAAGFRYKYTDTDGTEHYFKSSGTSRKYVDEEGLDLTLTVYSSTNSALEKYMLEMANGEKISFTSSGKVRRLYDSDGNYLQYYYVGSSYVDEVHDGSAGYHSSTTRTGRRTALYYDSNTRLTSVTDSSGRTTSLTYDSTGLLTRITYPDDTYTSFSYTNNKLSKVVARDGYTLVYEYPTTGDAAEKSRVIKVTEYNNTGTVSDSTKGNSLSMAYTGYNYTEFTDNRGRSETYQFDNIGRTTCIIDATGGATKYDYTDSDTKTAQANKLTGMSAVAHHVNNLLTDTSFEASTSAWTAGSGASVVSENPRLGSKSMKLTGEASASRTVTLSAGDYTFSAYVKTGADGVNPQLEVKNGGTILAASSALTTEGDYTRLSVSFTAPQGSTELILKTSGSGSAWFDTAQLETGLTVNEYNLLENSSFEDTSSTVWTGSGLSTSTDGYKTGGISGNAYGLTGSITASKRIYQSVPINKPAGSIAFSLTGMAKAASVPLTKDSGRIFALVAKTTFTDGSYSEKKFTLNPDVKLWQYTTGVVAYTSAEASKTVQKIEVGVLYEKNANPLLLDDVMLVIDATGTSYTYDADGNLISAKDNAGRNESYTYSNARELTEATTADNKNYSYTYHSSLPHRLLSATSHSSDIKFAFGYDDNGNVTSTTTMAVDDSGNQLSGTKKIVTTTTYNNDGNYVASVIDPAGNPMNYDYDPLKGTLLRTSDYFSNETTYTYDPDNDRLLTVSQDESDVAYSYNSKGQLTGIDGETSDYTLTYDAFGNVKTVKVGTTTLVTHTYGANNGNLLSSAYGNGFTVEYVYDSLDRVTKVKYNGTIQYEYVYNAMGQLAEYTDHENEVSYTYYYDLIGRLLRTEGSDGTRYETSYDNVDKVTEASYTYEGERREMTYSYSDRDNLPETTGWGSNRSKTQSYDALGRLNQSSIATGSSTITSTYGYWSGMYTDRTTATVSSIDSSIAGIPTYGLGYNEAGQVWEFYLDDVMQELYSYDGKGQLILVDARVGKDIVYNYDLGGNLTSVEEYNSGYSETTTPNTVNTYTYGNANWPDQLTSYNGESIVYDAIGNPTTYRGATLTWNGRRLTNYNGNGLSASYTYNEDGIRTSKTVNGVTTEYFLSGSTILAEKTGDSITWFLYDMEGNRVGYEYNGATYWYVTNIQGDVMYVVDSSGTPIGKYDYSHWGDCTATLLVDSASEAFAANPFTYRGYYYDNEVGLYYLQSRYYDAEVGRFINSDGYAATGQGFTGNNMYAYCLNSPLLYCDDTGTRAVVYREIEGMVVPAPKPKVIPPTTRNPFEDVLDAMTDSSNSHSTFSVGVNFSHTSSGVSGGTGWSVSGDSNFNYAIQKTNTTGVGYGVGGSAGLTFSWTNAHSVTELEGYSESMGVSFGIPIALTIDVVWFETPTNQRRHGVTVGIAPGCEFDFHYNENKTTDIIGSTWNPVRSIKKWIYG